MPSLLWNKFLRERVKNAFPGVTCLRVNTDLDKSYTTINRSPTFDTWIAYRGLLWEFGGGVRENPYRAVYACRATSLLLMPVVRREGFSIVNSLYAAVTAADVLCGQPHWFMFHEAVSRVAHAIDGLPWEIHAINDRETRRVAGAAYLDAQV